MVRDAWAQLLAITDYRALSVQLLNAALTDDSSVRASICHHEQLMTASGNILAASRHSPAITPRALVATWEGLLVMQSYFPSLEPGEIIRARLESRSLDAAHTPIHVTPLPLSTLVPPGFGYATGQSRRRQIVEDATLLFARNGYHRTTLRELAAEVGISSSTLLHHFGDKAGLLAEVLRRRDEQLVDRRGDEILDPRLELGELGDEARRDLKAERGLIDMYAVLSTEAAHPEHPAHAYFAYRYARTIDYFESLIVRASADVSDPHLEAVWLVALWDGLQYQLMLNPQDIDLPSELEHHIEATLGIAPGESHSRN
ncbi:TetR/AcrR family transcriptional regulator [Microbacterium sp. LWH12-1.2]|uniref:TetR/AcrR family transcriptional regulator n=1 Tax=Microbacterium sp. LWH12-1.2 TaxID=3135259 RepID=UPI003421A593